jgi:methionyl-tRNA formyltransferase
MDKKDLRIVFMGTPDFAVESLRLLIDHGYQVVAVITSPDKPAGRGQKMQMSAVKKFATEQGLFLLQPEKLKDPAFLQILAELHPDLQIVVAFRMLPEVVWSLPRFGTFNLHASLLPSYRGAAPINWAIINGETETGVTTFFLSHEIDTGEIILQKKIAINEQDSAGELHDRMMIEGAELVINTVDIILSEKPIATIKQPNDILQKPAPKLFTDTCRIDWSQQVEVVYNFIRGLSPYPAAWSNLMLSNSRTYNVKIFASEKEVATHQLPYGTIVCDHKKVMKIAVYKGFIHIKNLQLAGKKRMPIEDFLRGYMLDEGAKME